MRRGLGGAAGSEFAISLLPFLAVLSCTIGTLILVLIAVSIDAASNADQVIDVAGPGGVLVERAGPERAETRSAKTPIYVECDAAGFRIYGAAAGGGATGSADLREETLVPGAQVEASFKDIEERLKAGGALDASIVSSIRGTELRAFLERAYARRDRESYVFLVRPSGVPAFTNLFELVSFLNQAEVEAGRARLDIGFDAILEGGKLRFRRR